MTEEQLKELDAVPTHYLVRNLIERFQESNALDTLSHDELKTLATFVSNRVFELFE